MKNQYAGDIGDYTKLALLRVIENIGLSVGVNWCFTPDDEGSKDGRRIEYLDAPCDTPDQELFDSLYHIVKIKQVRTVKALMDGGLLKETVFYSEPLIFAQVDNPRAKREDWHKKSLDCLNSVDVVFLDPDNGFIPDSVSPYSSRGNKYVTCNEVAEYYSSGKTVIVYSHRDRSPEIKYISRLCQIKEYVTISPDSLMCIKAHRYSPRDYFFIMQPAHQEALENAVDTMLGTSWKDYLSRRKL